MKNVQPGMNVARQRSRFDHAIGAAPTLAHARYLTYLRDEFDAGVAGGQPQPFSWFYPRYEEEFDL